MLDILKITILEWGGFINSVCVLCGYGKLTSATKISSLGTMPCSSTEEIELGFINCMYVTVEPIYKYYTGDKSVAFIRNFGGNILLPL